MSVRFKLKSKFVKTKEQNSLLTLTTRRSGAAGVTLVSRSAEVKTFIANETRFIKWKTGNARPGGKRVLVAVGTC